jgi:hypothetical protein
VKVELVVSLRPSAYVVTCGTTVAVIVGPTKSMRFGYESRKGHNESAHPVHPEAALFVPDCVDEETDEVRAGDVLELVNFKNKPSFH